jgi:hypothetical protein
MTNLIKVKFDGTEIWIEPEGEAVKAEAPEKVGVISRVTEKIIPFEEVSDIIRAYCTALVKTFNGLKPEHSPSRISAEFGLKFGGEGNIYLVKSTAECSLKIMVEWQIK